MRRRSAATALSHKGRCEELARALEGYRELLLRPAGHIRAIEQFPRYLRAFTYRIEAAFDKPMRYAQCAGQIDELRLALEKAGGLPQAAFPPMAAEIDAFAGMIEEYAIAVFAHGRVPVRFPISLERLLQSPVWTLDLKPAVGRGA